MTAEANLHFQHFKLLRKVENYPGFTLYQVELRPSQVYPQRALLKEYKAPPPEAFKEISMLMEIGAEAPDCQVVQYLHHIMARKKLYVFLEDCENTLARELEERRRSQQKWTEGQVLTFMQGLLDTLGALHSRRIVHRNINPATLLIKNGRLKLAHFEDSKQIHVGTTLASMTSIHGFETYYSPQLYQAWSSNSSVPYQATYKDDIWAVGRVFYDMLALRRQEDLLSLMDDGERGFSTCVERDLRSRGYSPRLTAIILKMLAYNNAERPDAPHLLELVCREMSTLIPCSGNCGLAEYSDAHLFPLSTQYFCLKCVTATLDEAIQKDGNLQSLPWPSSDTLTEQLAELPPSLQSKVALLRLNESTRCHTRGCTRSHSSLRIAGGEAHSYTVNCECGSRYCSYCHLSGGHGVLGFFASCPKFTAN